MPPLLIALAVCLVIALAGWGSTRWGYGNGWQAPLVAVVATVAILWLSGHLR